MTKVSALQREFLMMILRIPSLITNEGNQQIIIHVAVHENACFSKRAAVALLIIDITSVFACSIKIRVTLLLRPYNSTRCDKKLDKALISLLCKTKTKTKINL